MQKLVIALFLLPLTVSCLGTRSETAEVPNIDFMSDTFATNYEIFTFDFDGNRLSMSGLPGKEDLKTDIQLMQRNDVTAVVSLVTQEELENAEVSELSIFLRKYGILHLHVPIEDYGVPQLSDVKKIEEFVKKRFNNGEHVLIHCHGGLGRSGTIVGCLAKTFLNEENPIDFVRNVRGPEAIETAGQEKFVRSY